METQLMASNGLQFFTEVAAFCAKMNQWNFGGEIQISTLRGMDVNLLPEFPF